MAEKMNISGETPPETIEEDIARTRREMSGTVSAIQEKISPGHLKEEVKEKIMTQVKNTALTIGKTAKDAGSAALDTVKANPLPIAMIAVGVAWLLFNRTRKGRYVAERGSAIKERAGELGERVQSKVGELSGRFRETGSELADRARQSARNISASAQEQARVARNRFQDMVEDNPLGTAFAAFAIGAAIGFIIPETGKEAELMGPASASLLEKAKETAKRTLQKVQHAAESAVQTAEAEFKKTA
jgi:ElaB/YqjD/DUF883 family membrane-anchored ribosome-binding protein